MPPLNVTFRNKLQLCFVVGGRMVIIALADIHGNVDYLPAVSDEICDADLVLIAGDVTHFGSMPQAEEVLSVFRQYDTPIFAVPGNCDTDQAADYLTKCGINLHNNCVNINNISFIGIGGSLPCPGRTPNESPESGFVNCVKEIESKIPPNAPFVLVTHQPARSGVVDIVWGKQTGSQAIRDFIEKTQPLLAVSGHIHEAVGMDKIGETVLVNPGPFSEGRYAHIELNTKVESVQLRAV